MRNIIYLTGITASGKTTIAKKLSDHLNIPFVKADDIYSMIARELHHPKQEQLVMPEAWKEYPDFGLLKIKYYRELLKDIQGDFIIEGFPLFFEQDRQIIEKIIGEHTKTFFRFVLPFDIWRKYADIKFGGSHLKADFLKLNGYFENPGFHYELEDPNILFVHYAKYQREGFTDKKWELLKFDEASLSGKSVIDLGCNEGWIGRSCMELGASPVFGVDYNWRYLEIARSSGLDVELSDLDAFEFKQKFDIVLCLAVFHYVRDKERLLEKIAAATNELFILEVPVTNQQLENHPVLALYDTGQCQYFIPSLALLDIWLKRYFKSYIKYESVAPDNSRRFIFKCYK